MRCTSHSRQQRNSTMELRATILVIIALTNLCAAFVVNVRDYSQLYYFNQTLDHFDPDNQEYFQQRYYKVDDYFREGAPIFLEIGGEDEMGVISQLFPLDIARENSGLFFKLEHRYYGKSVPESYSGGIPRYLSSEQALEDIANFIRAHKELYPNSPWIVSGCSYAGNLATWMRLKYPHLVNGAIAGSAPVLAKVDFYEYIELIGEVVMQRDPLCYQKLVEANEEFTTLVKTDDGQKKLAGMFGSPRYDPGLAEKFHIKLYDEASASNDVALQYLKYHQPYNSTVCNLVRRNTHGQSTLELLINMLMLPESTNSLGSIIRRHFKNGFGYRSLLDGYMWDYQMCNEFGYFQTLSSTKQPFGVEHNIDDEIHNTCRKFNIDRETVEENVRKTNLRYGGKTPNVTNVVFIHASNDPWNTLGVLSDLSSSARVFMFQGLSHCEYYRGRGYFDVPDERIPEWMKIYDEIESIVRCWF